MEQGVDINAIVPGLDSNVTTLHWCSWLNHYGKGQSPEERAPRYLKTVRFLLEHGADPNIQAEGNTPLDWAWNSPNAIKEPLKAYGGK